MHPCCIYPIGTTDVLGGTDTSSIYFSSGMDAAGLNRSDNADARIFVKDAKKIILNANAFNESCDQELRGFLQYVTTGKATTAYTGRVEQMIQNRAIDYPNYSPPRKIPAITKIRHTGTKTYCI